MVKWIYTYKNRMVLVGRNDFPIFFLLFTFFYSLHLVFPPFVSFFLSSSSFLLFHISSLFLLVVYYNLEKKKIYLKTLL